MNARYWMILIAAFLIMFVSGMAISLSLFVQPLADYFGELGKATNMTSLTFHITLVSLLGIISMPVLGQMVNKFGARLVIMVGGIFISAGFIILSLASSVLVLNIGGFLIGLFFSGTTNVTGIILINTWFHARKGLVMGVVMGAPGLAGVLASAFLPGFITTFGWRASYLFLAALVFLILIPVALFLVKNKPEDVKMLPYGSSISNNEDNNEDNVENGELTGIPYKQAIKSKRFYILYIVTVLVAMLAGFIYHIPSFFNNELIAQGVSMSEATIQAGRLLSIMTFVMIFASIIIGLLNDRLGTIRTTALILLMYALAFISLTLFSSFQTWSITMTLMAFGQGVLTVLLPLIINKIFGNKDFSSIWGTFLTSTALGSSIGVSYWSIINDLTGSYQLGFYIAIVFCALAFLVYYLSIKRSENSLDMSNPHENISNL